MTKGFITVAAGEYYCKLATHLYYSYKLFGNSEYPFYVITDRDGETLLKNVFDGVIVKNDLIKSSVDKLKFFTDTPFDETIFIDADCSVVNDLNYLFTTFEDNNSDISAISGIHSLENRDKGIQFGKKAIEELNLTYDFPNFNGGVYYYRKSEQSAEYIDFMLHHILPNYHRLGLLSGNKNEIYDEPIIIVAMIYFGMKTVPLDTNIMYLVQKPKKVKWNIRKHKCKFQWYESMVSPSIIHWKVGGTETYNYEKYDATINGKYLDWSLLKVIKQKLLSFIKFYIYPKLLKVCPRLHNLAVKYKK